MDSQKNKCPSLSCLSLTNFEMSSCTCSLVCLFHVRVSTAVDFQNQLITCIKEQIDTSITIIRTIKWQTTKGNDNPVSIQCIHVYKSLTITPYRSCSPLFMMPVMSWKRSLKWSLFHQLIWRKAILSFWKRRLITTAWKTREMTSGANVPNSKSLASPYSTVPIWPKRMSSLKVKTSMTCGFKHLLSCACMKMITIDWQYSFLCSSRSCPYKSHVLLQPYEWVALICTFNLHLHQMNRSNRNHYDNLWFFFPANLTACINNFHRETNTMHYTFREDFCSMCKLVPFVQPT